MMFARKTTSTLLALLALASTGCGNHGLMTSKYAAVTSIRATPGNANAPRYTNRMVVKYRADATDAQVRSIQSRFKLASTGEIGTLGLGGLALPEGANAASTIAALAGQPGVEYAEPDFVFSTPTPKRMAAKALPTRKVAAASAVVNDADFAREWGMVKIGMPTVWSRNAGSPTVTVAVVDTGVDLHHPDLQGSLMAGYSVLKGASSPDDDHGHGTHVSGVIAAAANNGAGIAGIAPHCKIMPVKVLGKDGKGDTLDIVAGIIWAVDHGAKVINMSLGGTGGSRALMAAIQYAQSKDVVLVAAMGNDGANSQEYPAGYPGVIGVGATDEEDGIAEFSNFGSWISVSAPGVDIFSTLPTHNVTVQLEEGKDTSYDAMDGTSMASPFVAGLAALVRSQFPGMSAAQVKARIERSADDQGDPGFDDHYGWGRINAAKALAGS
jgi:type VII secretion-associated serine protease mycosin